MDPSFTDDEQKLPLTSMATDVWMVNNPSILLSFTNDGTEDYNLTSTYAGTIVSIGYNGVGMPYIEYFNFFNWLTETVMDGDGSWLCSGSLGGYC
jgi:hypothetical protein